MMEKKRVLIISSEPWRQESSGGNVLTNLFSPLKDEFEFAQIYTNSQLPSNNVCKRYFHLSEKEMLSSILHNHYFGNELYYENYPENDITCSQSKDITSGGIFFYIRRLRWEIFQTVRYLLWGISKWKSPRLKKFIDEFNPDIIFAPMYYDIHLHRLDRYVAKLTKKKLISYVYDDHLSLRQYSWSPVYWYNRLVLRYNVKKTAKYYSLLYTMTQEQMDEYQPILKVPMKILKKGGDFNGEMIIKEKLDKPLKIVYGGNLFYHRDKLLCKLAEALENINRNEIKAQLYIYTQNPITPYLLNKLNDGRNSFLMGKVSERELKDIYRNKCDIALHVESFSRKPRLITRLSFSTKIIDLLSNACCIFAVCWSQSSPYKYLKKEDAAICVSDPKNIEPELIYLIENQNIILDYRLKAWECGKRNHDTKNITALLKQDFTNSL